MSIAHNSIKLLLWFPGARHQASGDIVNIPETFWKPVQQYLDELLVILPPYASSHIWYIPFQWIIRNTERKHLLRTLF